MLRGAHDGGLICLVLEAGKGSIETVCVIIELTICGFWAAGTEGIAVINKRPSLLK